MFHLYSVFDSGRQHDPARRQPLGLMWAFLSKPIFSCVRRRQDTKYDDTPVSRGRWLRDRVALYAGSWLRPRAGGLWIISRNQGPALAQLVIVSSVTSWVVACGA